MPVTRLWLQLRHPRYAEYLYTPCIFVPIIYHHQDNTAGIIYFTPVYIPKRLSRYRAR